MAVEIFRVHADQIMREAAEALPNECCGLLVGVDNRILEIIPSLNVATDPRRHFEVDPQTLLATHRRARTSGLQLLGSYHSHPTTLLTPSLEDATQATETMPLWLLASPTDLAAWRWFTCANFAKMDLLILP